MHDKNIYHCTRGDEEIRTGQISSGDRVLVQVYSKGKNGVK